MVLLPTGPGEPRPLDGAPIADFVDAKWFPDARRIAIVGVEPGRSTRLYVQDIEKGRPRTIAEAGTVHSDAVVSPDGKTIAVIGAGGSLLLVPAGGGKPRTIAGLPAGCNPIRWSADGHSIYLSRLLVLPGQILQLDLESGRSELVKELMPDDPTGVVGITRIRITPDGKSYAYAYSRSLSDLYTVDGLR
jgi:Tol biopolymer transport system component